MKNLSLITILILTLFGVNDVKSQDLMTYQKPVDYEMPPKKIPTIRKYWVSLPKDYDQTKNKYPILFLFDGNEQFLRNIILSDADQLTRFSEIPPCIIVGIIQRNRNLDFGPMYAINSLPNSNKVNGDKFFDFIKEELLPELKKKYRTQDFKIGIGHSLGGLFLLNSFTKDPEFFNGIIAISPALEMDRDSILFSNIKKTLNNKISKQTYFCWASGSEGINETAFKPGSNALKQLFSKNNNSFFKYKFIDLPGKNHNLTPAFAMLSALNFVFDDWNINRWYDRVYTDKKNEYIAAYTLRNKLIKLKYGFDEDPKEDQVQNFIGRNLMAEKKYIEALVYLGKAVDLSPLNSGHHEDLSEVEEHMKNYPAALAALKIALTTIDKNAEDYNIRLEKYQDDLKRLEGLVK